MKKEKELMRSRADHTTRSKQLKKAHESSNHIISERGSRKQISEKIRKKHVILYLYVKKDIHILKT